MRYLFPFSFFCTSLFAMEPSEAFDKLMEGNRRFVEAQAKAPRQDRSTRVLLSQAQAPFAVIVACADSRVAPEILFDQGLGDLFVIRVAGNVVGPLEMESIIYAAKHLGSSAILVMGHESCGAVDAVIQNQISDVPFIAQIINSSVIKAKAKNSKNLLKTAIEINAETQSKFVKRSLVISELVGAGKIDVRSAYYDFESGKVVLL